VRVFLSFDECIYIYIYIYIYYLGIHPWKGYSYLCGVERRLVLEREVALVLELFVILALIRGSGL
jgi:hypothetical protein